MAVAHQSVVECKQYYQYWWRGFVRAAILLF